MSRLALDDAAEGVREPHGFSQNVTAQVALIPFGTTGRSSPGVFRQRPEKRRGGAKRITRRISPRAAQLYVRLSVGHAILLPPTRCDARPLTQVPTRLSYGFAGHTGKRSRVVEWGAARAAG